MIDTGGTIAKAVKQLQDAAPRRDRRGHPRRAVRSGRRTAGRQRRLGGRLTNTLPIRQENQFEQLTVLSIAPLIANAIRAVFENGSVTWLFDGDA